MTEFNNNLVPDLQAKEHDDHDRMVKTLSSCSSPSAGSAPDFTKVLQRMQHILSAHPWWKRRIDGTPLATDLPVRAAVECIEIIHELMPNNSILDINQNKRGSTNARDNQQND